MPLVNCDPRSRRAADPQARRSVRVGLYQRWPTALESELLRSYVASQPGWRISLRSADYASGNTLNRPGLQRVLQGARSGDIDVLVIRHVYGLSRRPRHLAFLLDELTSRGVRVVSATEPSFGTETAHDVFLMCMGSAFAEIEHTGAIAARRDRRRHEQQSGDESPLAG